MINFYIYLIIYKLDSLTHIALGACMGEAFAGKKIGKKAMLWGILAQSIPDIDFIASFWLNTSDNLLAHRGITHSILFAIIITPIIAWFAFRLHRSHHISFLKWILFIGSVILIHLFLDAFNNYGVGWFEPFSHLRISFNTIYVADPFFSVIPGIALVMLIFITQKSTGRNWIWKTGLIIPFFYLLYSVGNKFYVTAETKKILAAQNINFNKLLITPAPLQTWLWFIAVGNDSGFYTGYRSVFDKQKYIDLHFKQNNYNLKALVKEPDQLNKLIQFSQGFYILEKRKDTLVFYDLRFGQIIGWQNPLEDYTFYYYLQPDINNTLVVQRGRFAKWNKQSFKSLLYRIKGN